MIAVWATSELPRFPRPGTRPQPLPPSKLPATWSTTCTAWQVPIKTMRPQDLQDQQNGRGTVIQNQPLGVSPRLPEKEQIQRFCRTLCRACLSPSADRRAERVLHRPAICSGSRSGDSHQAGRDVGAQVTEVSLPRSGRKRTACLRHRIAIVVWSVGLSTRRRIAGGGRGRRNSPIAQR